MSTEEKRKEGISLSYVRAIAAAAGANSAKPEDDYGIDLNLREVKAVTRGTGIRLVDGVTLDAQVKCSKNVTLDGADLVYDLEAKNYQDLIDAAVNTPRILILVKIPDSEADWISQDDDRLLIRNCAYWVSLRGKAASTNSSSVRVRIPVVQKFSTETLKGLFAKIKNGVAL